MENYPISISLDKQVYHLEIGEYLHQDGDIRIGKLKRSGHSDNQYLTQHSGC